MTLMGSSSKGINVSRRKSTLDLLHKAEILCTKPKDTPMTDKCNLDIKNGEVLVDKKDIEALLEN